MICERVCGLTGEWVAPWPRRLFMLDFDRTGIDQFVSLGSPLLPPPEGVIDQARVRAGPAWCV